MDKAAMDSKNIVYPPGGILLWIIIFLELVTFGIAIIYMVFYGNQEPKVFHASRLQLNAALGTVNTIVLITSGFFMARSINCLRANLRTKSAFYLKMSMLGGFLFLVLKGVEYYAKIEVGLTLGHNTFFMFYWLLTLFHVVHVIVGLVILGFLLTGLNEDKQAIELEDMEAGAAFWHMCDLIWLLIFPVIYLLF